MRKTLQILGICVVLLMTAVVMAGYAKDFPGDGSGEEYGVANIVGDNFSNTTAAGWVRYSKESKCLHTSWVAWGLEPFGEYQLKLHTKKGDPKIAEACGYPNELVDGYWECGYWDGEGFLVVAIVTADENGHIGHSIDDCLPAGEYKDVQFMITRHDSPWATAWTWEDSPETDDPGDLWGGDISAFTLK